MTPSEKGRFCGSCAKEVVDFTEMSKHEIQQYFITKTKGITCGRIGKGQLTILNQAEEKLTTRFILKPWWIAAATFLFIAKPGFSLGEKQFEYTNRLKQKPQISNTCSEGKEYNQEITIKGTLIDSSTQETLPSAIVVIKGTKQRCSSDFEGNFTLQFNADYNHSVIIEVGYNGYETKSIHVLLNQNQIKLDTIFLNKESNVHSYSDIKTQVDEEIQITEAVIPESVINKESISRDSSITILGNIIDENGESLPHVNIFIVGTSFGVVSDFDGKFEFNVPFDYQDTLILKLSSLGYEQIEIKLIDLKKEINIGSIQLTERDLIGEIVYVQTPAKRLFGRIKDFFLRLFN